MQIGRIPNEWARCLLPLVREKKVRLEGCCKYAPAALGIMDTIVLNMRYSFCSFNFYVPITRNCHVTILLMEKVYEYVCNVVWAWGIERDGFVLFLCYVQRVHQQFHVAKNPSNFTEDNQ